MKFKKTKLSKKEIILISVFAFFALIFGLISLVNHYQLRTYALDLGVFNHAIFSFSHFKNAYFTLGLDGNEVPFLALHFSLISVFYAPLYYLFGTYTLLIIQILAILMGGFGAYKYARKQFDKESFIPILIVIYFFSIWGIYSALSFDFHNNVIGAMLIIWFVYFLEDRKLITSFILLLLILFTKEVMAIWLFFIIIGLMIKNRKTVKKDFLKFEIPAAIFCLIYGILVITYFMPALQGSEDNLQYIRYSHLGNSFFEIVNTIISRPIYAFSLLFENTLNEAVYNGIKAELHLMILVSGGIALIFRPAYLFMLIPIYMQKLFANDYAFWGINGQYSIEFAPILALAVIDFIKSLPKYKIGIILSITILSIIFSFAKIEHRVSKWYNPQNLQFYKSNHYKSGLNTYEIKNALKLIEKDAIVSAHSCLAPYLAFREKIYHFPIVKDADYIAIVTKNRNTYPLNSVDYFKVLNEYKNSIDFEILFESKELLLLKRLKEVN